MIYQKELLVSKGTLEHNFRYLSVSHNPENQSTCTLLGIVHCNYL